MSDAGALAPHTTLSESFAWCGNLTRKSGSNFYFSFFTLPRGMFRDMCVLYAFMRVSDDLGDDTAAPREQRMFSLERWREMLLAALDEAKFAHPLLPALADVVSRRHIPHEYLLAVLDGVRTDLDSPQIQTFEDLSRYCYQVAGAVGLCCIHIWGYSHTQAIPLAVDCGLAFQLTNILRDLGEDARIGRCYIPREDLTRFHLSFDDLKSESRDSRFLDLMAWETARARDYFASARRLIPLCHTAGQPILAAMIATYHALLDEIESSGYDVFHRRIRLSPFRKIRIVTGALARYRWFALNKPR
jgi:phytoene synthase